MDQLLLHKLATVSSRRWKARVRNQARLNFLSEYHSISKTFEYSVETVPEIEVFEPCDSICRKTLMPHFVHTFSLLLPKCAKVVAVGHSAHTSGMIR